MSRKRFGLCVGKSSVSAVLVKSGMREHEVLDWAHIPFDDAAPDPLADALIRVTERMDLQGASCSASIPASEFSFRNVRIPFSEEKKIRQILPYELKPALPGPVEEMIFDFQSIGTGTEGELLAGAIGRDRLGSYLATLEKAGINAQIIAPGGWGVARCLSGAAVKKETCLLLYGEGAEAVLFSLLSGRICLARPVPAAKGEAGAYRSLALKILQVLNGVNATAGPATPFSRIRVIGRRDLMDAEALQTALAPLGLEISAWDPVRGVNFPAGHAHESGMMPPMVADAYALAVSFGETANLLNFRRGPFRFEPTRTRRNRRLLWAAMLSAVSAAALLANLALVNHRMARTVRRLDQGIETVFRQTFPEVTRIVEPLHQMRQKIAEAEKQSGGGGGSPAGHRVTEIMDHISRRIPTATDVEVTRLVYGMDRLSVSGNTDSYKAVNEMKTRLEQDRLFSQVEISSATVNKKDGRIQFTLKVAL